LTYIFLENADYSRGIEGAREIQKVFVVNIRVGRYVLGTAFNNWHS